MKRRGLLYLLPAIFAAGLAVGRAQITTGTISGVVSDSTGAAMPGATVTLQNADTGIARTVTTDSAGRYSAPSLSLGNYRVTANMTGFQNEVRTGIVLTVGREAVVNLQLAVGTVSQSVEVTGEAPLVETTNATVGYLVADRTVRELPLNGRDLSQLLLLNPGVNIADNGTSGNAYAGWGKKISISGMREEHNSYLLDGTYIDDMDHHIPAGPSGSLLGVETVREFQVLTNSFGAQYGRVLGGVFNAVSKSGTNEFHGDVYEFLRNIDLDAARWEDNAQGGGHKPPFRRNQFGATLGGPVEKDKLFFFVAYEGLRQQRTNTQTATVPDAAARLGNLGTNGIVPVSSAIQPYLDPSLTFPLPNGRDFGDGTAQYTFQAAQPTRDDFGQGRLDYQLSNADSMFARFTASNSYQSNVTSFPVFHTIQTMETRLLTLSETHIFSPRLLNSARFAFNRIVPVDTGTYPSFPANLLSVPNQPPPAFAITGLTGFEGFQKPPSDVWITNRFGFNDDLNYTMGAHSLQFGGMFERMQFNMNQPNRPYGEWSFNSLTTFLAAQPNTYRGTPPQFGNSIRGFRQDFMALYLQDDWKITPRLTINLGVRWEPYTIPTEQNGLISNQRNLLDPTNTAGSPYWINHSWKDFGPRFGFAWSPFANGKMSIRGGTGLYFMPNDAPIYRTQTVRNPVLFPEFNVPDTGHFPNALAEIAAVTTLGVTEGIEYNNTRSPRALQYNLTIERQIGDSNVISAAFVGNRGISNTSYGNYNVPPAVFDGVSLAVPAGATLINPNFAEVDYYGTNANAWYNALAISLKRQFSKGLQAQVAYTWSKSISEADQTAKSDYSGSGGGGTLFYAPNLLVGKGLSGFNVGQVLVANYSYDLPLASHFSGAAAKLVSGWQLTGIVTARTGQPFGPTASSPSAITALAYNCCRPNRNTGFTGPVILGTPNEYFNPLAFSAPGARELGNAGRNILIGPGLATWDSGLTKDTALTERVKLQFRAELFNLLNRPNFALPSASLFTAAPTSNRVLSAGTITSTITDAREIQLSLKLLF